jgi:hypothetical protein
MYARYITEEKRTQILPTASAVLEDGTMVELIFRPDLRRTLLAIYTAGRWTLQEKVDLAGDVRLVPFSPGNNLIKNEAVLLPSEPKIYGSEAELVSEIQQLIHRYVDFDPAFEKVATYYVLLSWLLRCFQRAAIFAFAWRLWKWQDACVSYIRLAVLQGVFCERRLHSLTDLPHAGCVQGYLDFRRSGFQVQRRARRGREDSQ